MATFEVMLARGYSARSRLPIFHTGVRMSPPPRPRPRPRPRRRPRPRDRWSRPWGCLVGTSTATSTRTSTSTRTGLRVCRDLRGRLPVSGGAPIVSAATVQANDHKRATVRELVEAYQRVRLADGFASPDPAFAEALPFRDLTGRNRQVWRVRALHYLITRLCLTVAPGLQRVLDLGAGNGWLARRL